MRTAYDGPFRAARTEAGQEQHAGGDAAGGAVGGGVERFRLAGYDSMLVYEKFGHPLGRHALTDLTHFKALLLHQLVKKYTFFDILLMPEPDLLSFHAEENAFFLDALPDQSLRAERRGYAGGAKL